MVCGVSYFGFVFLILAEYLKEQNDILWNKPSRFLFGYDEKLLKINHLITLFVCLFYYPLSLVMCLKGEKSWQIPTFCGVSRTSARHTCTSGSAETATWVEEQNVLPIWLQDFIYSGFYKMQIVFNIWPKGAFPFSLSLFLFFSIFFLLFSIFFLRTSPNLSEPLRTSLNLTEPVLSEPLFHFSTALSQRECITVTTSKPALLSASVSAVAGDAVKSYQALPEPIADTGASPLSEAPGGPRGTGRNAPEMRICCVPLPFCFGPG